MKIVSIALPSLLYFGFQFFFRSGLALCADIVAHTSRTSGFYNDIYFNKDMFLFNFGFFNLFVLTVLKFPLKIDAQYV